MYPYVALHTAKIHTLITLGLSNRTKPLVLKAQSRFPVGSIPIARSTLEATPGHAGLQDWDQDIDPMRNPWESTLKGAAVSWPHASPHRPEIQTYSHTQQFTKINCVIPTLPSWRERSQVAGLDPNLTVVSGCIRAVSHSAHRNRSDAVRSNVR